MWEGCIQECWSKGIKYSVCNAAQRQETKKYKKQNSHYLLCLQRFCSVNVCAEHVLTWCQLRRAYVKENRTESSLMSCTPAFEWHPGTISETLFKPLASAEIFSQIDLQVTLGALPEKKVISYFLLSFHFSALLSSQKAAWSGCVHVWESVWMCVGVSVRACELNSGSRKPWMIHGLLSWETG